MSFATQPSLPVTQDRTRYGVIAARIGTSHLHRLSSAHRMGGKVLNAGAKVYLTVEDVTRHPEAKALVRWVCRHPDCAANTWASKAELIASHPEDRKLRADSQVHLFYAVAEVPEQQAMPEKHDAKGRLMEAAVDAKPAVLLLLSDEE